MKALKTVFSWLGRFLAKVRSVVLDLGTALVVIFFCHDDYRRTDIF